MHCSSQTSHVNQVLILSNLLFKFNELNSLDLKLTSMDGTRLTLSIVLPLLFLLLLVLLGIIAFKLAVYIAGRKNPKTISDTIIHYDHVDKNNYGLTPMQ